MRDSEVREQAVSLNDTASHILTKLVRLSSIYRWSSFTAFGWNTRYQRKSEVDCQTIEMFEVILKPTEVLVLEIRKEGLRKIAGRESFRVSAPVGGAYYKVAITRCEAGSE